jgi:hypothetical protein
MPAKSAIGIATRSTDPASSIGVGAVGSMIQTRASSKSGVSGFIWIRSESSPSPINDIG